MKKMWIGALAALAVAGCARERADGDYEPGTPPGPGSISASLRDGSGAVRGEARVSQQEGDLRVRVEASNMAPGAYGMHIHAVGRCDASEFASAGPHWNPLGRQHGKDNPAGMHKGDLPNLLVGADGRGTLEYVVPAVRLPALTDADGAAIVIHAQPDDFRTDPSGNSGARIACGVLS